MGRLKTYEQHSIQTQMKRKRERELEPTAGTPEAHGRTTPALTSLQETRLMFQYPYHELIHVGIDINEKTLFESHEAFRALVNSNIVDFNVIFLFLGCPEFFHLSEVIWSLN